MAAAALPTEAAQGVEMTHPQRRLRIASALLLTAAPWLLAVECNPPDVVELDPVMQVEPTSVDFGAAPLSADSSRTITVSDPSGLDLHLAAAFSTDSDPAFRIGRSADLVVAGGTAEIEVVFRPLVTSQVSATLVLTSDSKKYPRQEVVLVGSGVDLGLPQIVVSPNPVDFGSVGKDTVTRLDVSIRNSGVRDLILDQVLLTDDGNGAFRLVTTAPAEFVLRPTDEVFLQVAFAPPVLGDFVGELSIVSNDPATHDLRLPLLGTGYDTPVAVLTTLDDISHARPLDTVRLDGSGSFSPTPSVTISHYEWHLALRPVGSTTTLISAGQTGVDVTTASPRADVVLDLAGRYEFALYVVDSRDVRSAAPAVLRVRAVPDEDLHLQLVWDHPTADFDLHFVRGSSGLFNHDMDCYFSNRFPNWFPDTPDANPSLDLDDQSGFGPENVNVKHPLDGVYTVFVHYWNARTTGNPAATATVRIYVRGQLAAELTQTFEHDELMWSVAELDWPVTLDDPVPITPLGDVVAYRRPF